MMVKLVLATILLLCQSHAFTSLSHFSHNCPVHLASVSEGEHDGDHKGNDENNKHNHKRSAETAKSEQEPVTRDMFYRDMLADPDTTNSSPKSATVKRKKKKGSSQYRVLDNRDSLPFLVQVTTPDPYTSNQKMEQTARKNTQRDRERQKKSDSSAKPDNKKNKKIRKNLFGVNGKDSIASSIYTRYDDGTLHQILGEFALDKSTGNGDIIKVGGDGEDGREYQVQKSRCQYKYAGGKRFVMVRKILEVKEIKRVLVEQEIRQIFDMDVDTSNGVTLPTGEDV